MKRNEAERRYASLSGLIPLTLQRIKQLPFPTVDRGVRLAELERDFASIQQQWNRAFQAINTAAPHNPEAEFPDSEPVLQQLQAVVEQASRLEHDSNNAARVGIVSVAKDAFAQQRAEFEKGTAFHRARARDFQWVMIGASVAAIVATLVLISMSERDATSHARDTNSASAFGLALVRSVWRLGPLLVIGYLLRFLGRAHQAHAEQSVLCDDRAAALGVADVLLQSGTVNQQNKLIESITESYLTFDRNAFRQPPPSPPDENPLKQVTKAVEAVKPILDALRPLTPRS